MFVFLVHISQIGWSIIPNLFGQAVGVARAVSEKLAVGRWMITAMGSVFNSVVQMERGSTSGIIIDDSKTL
jgi:hypothetical protein